MLKKLLCGATLICVAGFSQAATIVQDFTVARQITNYTNTISFNLFDDMGGTLVLESVEFSLFARSSGSARVENTNPAPTSITATLSTEISVIDSTGTLLMAAPSVNRMDTVMGFDGVIDYAGASGVEFLNLTTSDNVAVTLSDAADLMMYTGMGMTSVDFKANATSQIDGGGNLASIFRTFASGDLRVVYTFREAVVVSEPAHLALLGLSLLTFAGFRKATK